MAKIPYSLLPSETNKFVRLPLAKVLLNYKKTHKITPVLVVALIDSGADVCFCSGMIGAWLGIQFNKIKEKEFTAANRSTFKAKSEIITLHAYNKIYPCTFYFTDTLPKHIPIILGQIGFFDHFQICFNYNNCEITID
ncbi:MAG TPA: hypothetical protein VJB63_01700 [Patescibacteria group bacterium]|nr:hypothetical protein [Patescibacteria group bacterium]